jgi:hypothetical protein
LQILLQQGRSLSEQELQILFHLIELWLPTSLPQELDLSLQVLDLP